MSVALRLFRELPATPDPSHSLLLPTLQTAWVVCRRECGVITRLHGRESSPQDALLPLQGRPLDPRVRPATGANWERWTFVFTVSGQP